MNLPEKLEPESMSRDERLERIAEGTYCQEEDEQELTRAEEKLNEIIDYLKDLEDRPNKK